ncbi:hypothetical protein [Nocardioides limicola]|uniref:hypothetical protein n=1 Tax=Nocardioides limicola TaxID=2803368 RepID=UPI00193C639B|nr:hypothetical protein [Nocardioides sp. DJM-14]
MHRRLAHLITAPLLVIAAACTGEGPGGTPSRADGDASGGGSLDDALGMTGGGSRIAGIGACSEIEQAVRPLLTAEHTLYGEEVNDLSYPPGPYSFTCSWGVEDATDTITVNAHADWEQETPQQIRAQWAEERELEAAAFAQGNATNTLVFENSHNTALNGSYTLVIISPNLPNSGLTGQIHVGYSYGGGSFNSDGTPANGITQQQVDASRGVPSDNAVLETLYGLLEDADER